MLLQSVVECRRGVKTPSDLWITEEHLATSLVFNEKKRHGVGAGQPALKHTHPRESFGQNQARASCLMGNVTFLASA